MSTVEEALAEERKKITFSTRKISQFLYGKEEYAEIKEGLDTLPSIPYDFNLFNRGRAEIIKQAFRDFPSIYNAVRPQRTLGDHFFLTLAYMNQLPGSAHSMMFIKCIEIMGNEQQQEEFLARAKNYEIIGCYAQTEIAHGSDVRGLLTTATFDEKTDEFVIDTPSIEAAKYWPGDLGILATHALVYAELRIKDQKYGIHPFIVPIRDKEHNPLPNIEVGDIGPKIGFFSKDNGYLVMKKVRIPRTNMLQRFVTVTRNGQFKISGNPLIGYATMMEVRKMISYAAPKLYSCAITIATRYSFFRRQFKNAAKEEIRVIDYQLQQQKIVDRVAQYFALCVIGNRIRDLCDRNIQAVQQNNDSSLMAETHACLCLGKTFTSQIAYNGMQICRKACGGHGFSQYSGFPSLINEYAAHLTHEGENTVLYLQLARYILKNYKNFMMKQQPITQSLKYLESMDYLMSKKCEVDEHSRWSLDDIRVLLAQGVCFLLTAITSKTMGKPDTVSEQELRNKHIGIKLQTMAMVHSAYYSYNSFREAIVMEKDERVKIILEQLCKLFGINMVLAHCGTIAGGAFITKEQIATLKMLKEELLAKLRPNLMGIVDGFGIPDKFIRSALISGNPYENYLKLARENELNHSRLESVDHVLSISKHIKNPNPKL